MSADPYLNQLRIIKSMVPAADTLGVVLTELLLLSGNKKTFFKMTTGSANTVGLYKNGAPWGAKVNFKSGELASFVHELTHASCFDAYQSDLINYRPKKANAVAYEFTKRPLGDGVPDDVNACMNEVLRRQGWHDDDAKTFLTLNLDNLEKWADVTDFSAPVPWLDSLKTKQLNALEKIMKKGKATMDDVNRLQAMKQDNAAYGVITAPKKDKHKAAALKAEADRKKAYIKERINYGRIGMSGLGDVHFEYDTVVNQMLCQMFMWGFRPQTAPNPSMATLSAQIESGTVAAAYFYGRLELLAQEAYDRRNANRQILEGAAPVVTAPVRVINPPANN